MSDENRWQNDTEDYYNQNYYQSGTQGGAYGGGTGTGGRDDDRSANITARAIRPDGRRASRRRQSCLAS